ncbi:hypothetical protein [Fodinicola feengrottensis]|uniref:hypothetical protein n=1 Tax=Fodinicola feengrottensis TaxID=435914 RepID=UPI0013D00F62|nr:hypothetical protein [Fodinicola feengrottensis]
MLDEPRAVDTLKARGDLVWTYICIGDMWPYPGVMINDSLVGSRLVPWFQHSQGYTRPALLVDDLFRLLGWA